MTKAASKTSIPDPERPSYFEQGGAHAHLREYSFTILVCLVIGLIVWSLDGGAFPNAFVISLSIGLSVHTVTILGTKLLPDGSIFRIWLITIPVGVMVGLMIGFWITDTNMGSVLDGGSALFSLILALVATYVIHSNYSMNELQERLRREEMDRVLSENKLVETQLRLLQSQIEPHFLFNTLSNVVSLINLDPPRAELMLRKLTHFLRASLKRSQNEHSTLQDEIDLLSDYLAILKIRMEGRLDYQFAIEPEIAQMQFPPLILQPLVENAIVHGLEPMEEGGTIFVRAFHDAGKLVFEVEDTGMGLHETVGGAGLGMSNVKERLQLQYGPDVALTINDGKERGLLVRIELPEVGNRNG